MPANNSPTNRNIRRVAALERFKISPTGSLRASRTPEQKAVADVEYKDRKAVELAALQPRGY
jgi:hypothetical protein